MQQYFSHMFLEGNKILKHYAIYNSYKSRSTALTIQITEPSDIVLDCDWFRAFVAFPLNILRSKTNPWTTSYRIFRPSIDSVNYELSIAWMKCFKFLISSCHICFVKYVCSCYEVNDDCNQALRNLNTKDRN